ncbi:MULTISPECIES: hypothetical protein [Luteimonas]|uniref:Outer membrane protein beta-barrel domain-containing protein n=1 Tax=Luteimonas chenhongjianii TaxID=2006110 RepID=A0A290XEL9_9GAMM|nr:MULTISPECIES: hypothetical protein [Luteimonas]ATD67529.1 hypothetical protein CNR27_08845 [Luteimonas chenhongjianii]RPD83668.1 hypothetical protein EGK76_14730 [Luteimonas sp. 100069]
MRTWLILPFTALIATTAHAAGPEAGKWSVSLLGGIDVPVNGDVHGGATARVADLGALNPALAGLPAELRIRPRGHERIYDNALAYGLEVGYAFDDRREIYGQVRQTRADGGRALVGYAFVPALSAELPIYGSFSEYEALSAQVGYRYYFGTPDTARPFIDGYLGATRTHQISATFDIPAGGISIPNAPFYESGWAATGGANVGVIVPLGETFSMTLSGGVRYVSNLTDDDSALGGLELSSINDTGKRVSVPITLSGRWDF